MGTSDVDHSGVGYCPPPPTMCVCGAWSSCGLHTAVSRLGWTRRVPSELCPPGSSRSPRSVEATPRIRLACRSPRCVWPVPPVQPTRGRIQRGPCAPWSALTTDPRRCAGAAVVSAWGPGLPAGVACARAGCPLSPCSEGAQPAIWLIGYWVSRWWECPLSQGPRAR